MSSRQDLRAEIVRLTNLLAESNRQCTILQNKIRRMEKMEPDCFILDSGPNAGDKFESPESLVEYHLEKNACYFDNEEFPNGISIQILGMKIFRPRTLVVTSYDEHGFMYHWQEDTGK